MPHALLADLALLLHFTFILFVVGGGLVVSRHPRLAWLHLPAVAWGVAVEMTGWFCPLTDLENHWRALAGQAGYAGSCIDRYLTALIYPDGLTRPAQIGLGLTVLAINLWVYGRRFRLKRKGGTRPG